MAYGVKYRIEFLNEQQDNYRVDILEKDFTGTLTNLLGGDKPFLLQYQSGDNSIINAIRASEAEINFWATDNVKLKSFYSEDDEKYRVDFYCDKVNGVTTTTLLWSGFVVQDDCSEEFQDAPYVVTLTATDNLGLLKDITFDTAFNTAAIESIELISKLSLFNIIRICLVNTGISLPFRVYSNIYENGTLDRSDFAVSTMWEQTYVYTGKWLNEDGTWVSCYDILQEILFPLNATLLQAEGKWVLIRFTEAYLFDNAILGTEWATTFDNPQAITLNPNFTVNVGVPGVPIDHEFLGADAIKRILRPFKFVKYTFNYEQPRELIRNINLQELGDLITTYTSDGNTIKEYELPYWFETGFSGQPDVFIRVVIDSVGVETERYIVLRGGTFGGPYLRSSKFYINQNDRVNISFQLRTSDSQTGASNNTFQFRTDDGTNQYKINFNNGTTVDGSWATNGGSVFSYSADQNIDDWTTFSVDSLGVPVDGYFDIALNQLDFDGTINETHYKDFQITYIPFISDSTEIIGQTHTTSQGDTIKNTFDEEIKIDDSPKNAIAGTLFTPALTDGEKITRTSLWHRSNFVESKRLGEITTFERKFLAFKPRTIIEGTFTRVRYIKDDVVRFVSPLTIIQIEALTGLNFILGICEIDYMESTVNGTMWELYADDDNEGEFSSTYEFKYLYRTN